MKTLEEIEKCVAAGFSQSSTFDSLVKFMEDSGFKVTYPETFKKLYWRDKNE